MQAHDKVCDVLIVAGTVFDGTGAEPFRADIAIRDDRIAAIGDLSEWHAGRRIDAAGRRVVPGFIDIHTHSDITALFNPQMDSMVSQGVTTQVVGNCGLSLGLATDDDVFAFERRWLAANGIQITWRSLAGHLSQVESNGVATNYVPLIGQGALRKRAIGLDDRVPAPDELNVMTALIAQSMEEGAWGLSTGLEYAPSSYADVNEISKLCAVAGKYGGFYATHLRNEGDRLLEAVAEAIEIGERAGVAVQLSHHKAEGRANWGKVHRSLQMVDEARARGLDVRLDVYPYTAFQTSMSVQFLPSWANEGDNETVLGRLANPAARTRILADMRAAHPDWDDAGPDSPWQYVQIAADPRNREIQGRTVAELAREADRNPVELALDIIADGRNFVSAVNYAINEEDVAFILRYPHTMIGSDAAGTAPRGKMGEDLVHPRCYGTFPRVLGRYVGDEKTLTEADAILRMTALPADRLGLHGRGRLAAGCFADVVVYDPAAVCDTATYDAPHQYADGIDAVMVNGRLVWTPDGHTGTLPGRVLRHGTD